MNSSYTVTLSVNRSRNDLSDSDFDGKIDGDEIYAGTDPGNSRSVLQFKSFTVLPDDSLRFTWSSVAGHSYQIEHSSSPAADDWSALGDATVASSSESTATISDSGNPNTGFYRLLIVR